jgi:GNAT superfamily N-acetyltransferase
MNITYREGRREDCSKLAEFIYTASDGVVEFLFRDLIPGHSPQKIVAHNIEKNFRDKGIGGELISLTKQKAVDQGFNSLSLIALADNTDAHRLYYRCGFEIVSPVAMEPHELIPHEGGAYLMRCAVE